MLTDIQMALLLRVNPDATVGDCRNFDKDRLQFELVSLMAKERASAINNQRSKKNDYE